MYTFLIVLILIASVLMVLAVLVQNPKSGMASNFGASNQVMGVRQTADFLEKFTWGAATVIFVLSLIFTLPTFSSDAAKTEGHVQLEQNDAAAEGVVIPGDNAQAADAAAPAPAAAPASAEAPVK